MHHRPQASYRDRQAQRAAAGQDERDPQDPHLAKVVSVSASTTQSTSAAPATIAMRTANEPVR